MEELTPWTSPEGSTQPVGCGTPGADAVDGAGDTTVVPVWAERVEVGKREVETGRVRIRKIVREEEQVVDKPLLKETVAVERVPVNRFVDNPVEVRHEGDTMIIPVLEEVRGAAGELNGSVESGKETERSLL